MSKTFCYRHFFDFLAEKWLSFLVIRGKFWKKKFFFCLFLSKTKSEQKIKYSHFFAEKWPPFWNWRPFWKNIFGRPRYCPNLYVRQISSQSVQRYLSYAPDRRFVTDGRMDGRTHARTEGKPISHPNSVRWDNNLYQYNIKIELLWKLTPGTTFLAPPGTT